MTENEIAKHIMDAAFFIHRGLGPGLLETVYEVINFGESPLKNGFKRVVNCLVEP